MTGQTIDEYQRGRDAAYEEWAEWLVRGTDAPWSWKPTTLPPVAVLRLMPAIMYDYDNRAADGIIVHEDVTREDYAGSLREEWGCSTAFLTEGAS